ncbi:hypothetical protein P7K49_014986 [Saguinus oedipus]|uniref:Uncharacterized protein n=1 Tax=Saguinus oedipus TaxID=9490 RepID=A0ABQ9VAP5_SAGOE|nr:hypothetical protein P7K49_014986 [Saguinus oedipus]
MLERTFHLKSGSHQLTLCPGKAQGTFQPQKQERRLDSSRLCFDLVLTVLHGPVTAECGVMGLSPLTSRRMTIDRPIGSTGNGRTTRRPLAKAGGQRAMVVRQMGSQLGSCPTSLGNHQE